MSSKFVIRVLVLISATGLVALGATCISRGIKFDGQILLLAIAIICIPAYLTTLPVKAETKS